MHVLHSALATLDVATSFLATLCLLLAFRLSEKRGLVNLVLLSACAGALIGTKYPGAAILPSILLAYAFSWSGTRFPRQAVFRFALGLAAMCVGVIAAFLVTNPTALLRPQALAASVLSELEGAATDGRELRTVQALLEALDLRMWWDVWGKIGERVISIPLAFAALLGLLHAIARPTRRSVLVLVFVIGYSLVMGQETDGRYTIILVPALSAFAASLLIALPKKFGRFGAVMLIAVVVYATGFTGFGLASRLLPDPRTESTQLLVEHVASGSSIAIQGGGLDRRGTWLWPKIPRERYVILAMPAQADYVIVNGRDMGKVEEALRTPELTEPKSREAVMYWSPDEVPSGDVFGLYDDLLTKDGAGHGYRLLAAFAARPYVYVSFAPPDILIYESIQKQAKLAAPPPEASVLKPLTFERVAALEAYSAPPQVTAGRSASIDLYWRGLDMVRDDYTTFVHLLDTDWRLVAQSDQQPAGGLRPTSIWMKGEFVRDTHIVSIPGDTAPGTYRIEVGMYNSVSQERVEVYSAAGEPLGSSTIVGALEVAAVSTSP
jgi:hypothetical protein